MVAVVCAAGLLLTLGALCWQQTHAYSDSQALWRDSLAKNPRSAMVHYNLAVELEISGRSEEAREHYRWAIELEPDSASAYNNLGMMLAREQRPREAIELLREALRAAPDYARASWNLGLVLTQQGELDAALPHFRHALAQPLRFEEDRDQLIGSHVRLGTILLQHGRVKAARAELHRALALDADFVPAVFWLGEVALASDSPEHALRYFERVLSLEPGHRRALRQRRRALERIQAQRTEAPQGVARSPS